MAGVNRRIIGLTGGIATGKTTAAHYLHHHHHLPLWDADLLAREAVAPGSPILQRIAERYGADLLDRGGSLRRDRLRAIVLGDPAERYWLEAQIHPYVRQMLTEAQEETSHPMKVFVVPLLFEAQMTDLVTEIWVVCCDRPRQEARLAQRDRLPSAQIAALIAAQWPLEKKIAAADVVLDNNGDRGDLETQIDRHLLAPGPTV